MADQVIRQAEREVNSELEGKGRLLLRESGTEQVIRVMVECENEDECEAYAERLENLIRERGYACD